MVVLGWVSSFVISLVLMLVGLLSVSVMMGCVVVVEGVCMWCFWWWCVVVGLWG